VPRVTDLVLDALSLLYTRDTVTAEPALRRAVDAVMSEETAAAEQLRWLWFVNFSAMALWDDEACRDLTRHYLRLVRDSGALALLPLVLSMSTMLHLFEGDLAEAETLNEEAKAHAVAAGVWTTSGAMVQTGGDLGLGSGRPLRRGRRQFLLRERHRRGGTVPTDRHQAGTARYAAAYAPRLWPGADITRGEVIGARGQAQLAHGEPPCPAPSVPGPMLSQRWRVSASHADPFGDPTTSL
jgi:hypothetical protein